ncbi:MAG TPA: NnrU family protein [Planctomycetota bacterium]|nr:NnrU family protein [Planctomycetota bacterium]
MTPTLTIVVLWLAFALSHMLLSSIRFRPKLVAMLGDRGFQGAYSLIALATFVPLCTIYFRSKHAGPLLWSVPRSPALEWAIEIAMGVAMVLLFAGLMTPSPTSMSAGQTDSAPQPKGVHFLTRHALFMAMAIFGLVHLVPNGFASDVAFFGGFPVFVLIGTAHQDSRKLALDGVRYRPFYDATPLIPFTGRSTLRGLRELSRPALVVGIGATILIRYFHSNLFGR